MHHIRATIIRQNGKASVGKGFSLNELKEAGIDRQQAKKLGVRVDVKRKSTHKENIANIKAQTKPKS